MSDRSIATHEYYNVIKLFKCIKEKINIQKEINLFFNDTRSIDRELKREKKKREGEGKKKKKKEKQYSNNNEAIRSRVKPNRLSISLNCAQPKFIIFRQSIGFSYKWIGSIHVLWNNQVTTLYLYSMVLPPIYRMYKLFFHSIFKWTIKPTVRIDLFKFVSFRIATIKIITLI